MNTSRQGSPTGSQSKVEHHLDVASRCNITEPERLMRRAASRNIATASAYLATYVPDNEFIRPHPATVAIKVAVNNRAGSVANNAT